MGKVNGLFFTSFEKRLGKEGRYDLKGRDKTSWKTVVLFCLPHILFSYKLTLNITHIFHDNMKNESHL